MKFKSAPDLFWGMLIPVGFTIILGLGIFIYAAIDIQEARFLLFLLLPMAFVSILLIGRKDYFSYVHISNHEISASCFGQTFFRENWENINIGKFQKVVSRYQTEKNAIHYVYFSTIPIDLTDRHIYKNNRPSTKRMQEKAVFLALTPQAEIQIDKLISVPIHDYGLIKSA